MFASDVGWMSLLSLLTALMVADVPSDAASDPAYADASDAAPSDGLVNLKLLALFVAPHKQQLHLLFASIGRRQY